MLDLNWLKAEIRLAKEPYLAFVWGWFSGKFQPVLALGMNCVLEGGGAECEGRVQGVAPYTGEGIFNRYYENCFLMRLSGYR